MPTKISASILSADLTRLGDQVQEAQAAGADWIHVDVMDGRFASKLTIGSPVVAALRTITDLPLDVHLMVEQPERLIPDFAQAGADILTVHVEACSHLHSAIYQIKSLGVKAGVGLNPATPLSVLEDVLAEVYLVLLLAVDPGFGGWSHFPGGVAKTARLRQMLNERGLEEVELEFDGGVKPGNAAEIVAAGATALVAGSAVFNSRASVTVNVAALRDQIALAAG